MRSTTARTLHTTACRSSNSTSAKAVASAKMMQIREMAKQKIAMLELGKKLSKAGERINHVTGYQEIESLKRDIAAKELELQEARQESKEAKSSYSTAVTARKSSQSEVNDLLQRKSHWAEADVIRFTELVRTDHQNESNEKDKLDKSVIAEELVERKIDELMRSILARYHEEQVWSDKIRSLSTYGSLAITAANVLLFFTALVIVEPWRRRRMVEKIESRAKEREERSIQHIDESLTTLESHINALEIQLASATEPFNPSTAEYSTNLDDVTLAVPEQDSSEHWISKAAQQISWLQAEDKEKELAVAGALGVVAGVSIAVIAALFRR